MNKPLSRKQRELQLRREYILEVAQDIIMEDGYIGFTMDKIAEATEYAKGTIYQMFANKEEIMAALCTKNAEGCYQLFERAAKFEGNHRERMTAICVAHQIQTLMCPHEFSQQLLIKNDSIRDKVNPDIQQDMFAMESKIIKLISGIAQDAINAGEIKVDIKAEPLVFCLWSLSFGWSTLVCSDIELDKHGMSKSCLLVAEACNRMLDGFGWEPLYKPDDYQKTVVKIAETIFPNECEQTGLTQLYKSLHKQPS